MNDKDLLNIIEFNPDLSISPGWRFVEGYQGSAGNDGITTFKEVLIRASTLPKKKGYRLLFANGLAKGKRNITGEDKIKALSSRNLADPDLLWSLFLEEGQKTLRHLHDTYGVLWIESLRRILCCPEGYHHTLYFFRNKDGSWGYDLGWLGSNRKADFPALVLGE